MILNSILTEHIGISIEEEKRRSNFSRLLDRVIGSVKDSHLFRLSIGDRRTFLLASNHAVPLGSLSATVLRHIAGTSVLIRETVHADKAKWEQLRDDYPKKMARLTEERNWFAELNELEQKTLNEFYRNYFRFSQFLHNFNAPVFVPETDLSTISLAFVTHIIKSAHEIYGAGFSLECIFPSECSDRSITDASENTDVESQEGMDCALASFFSEEKILGFYDTVDMFYLATHQRLVWGFKKNFSDLKGYLKDLSSYSEEVDSEEVDSEEVGSDLELELRDVALKKAFPEYYTGGHYTDPAILEELRTSRYAVLTREQNHLFEKGILAYLNNPKKAKEEVALMVIGVRHMIGPEGLIARLCNKVTVEKLNLDTERFENIKIISDEAPYQPKVYETALIFSEPKPITIVESEISITEPKPIKIVEPDDLKQRLKGLR